MTFTRPWVIWAGTVNWGNTFLSEILPILAIAVNCPWVISLRRLSGLPATANWRLALPVMVFSFKLA